ncbi:MAG: hypothetical protein ACJAZP_003776 [Psychromonas sp.]|jgi:hypothetical protein|uniref:hypothetical protein n=1 Tax=Psychromonas sp. TaxID=1884585 RepID=UPI0039E4297D
MDEIFVDRLTRNYDCVDDLLDGNWGIYKAATTRPNGKNGGDEIVVIELNELSTKFHEAASDFFINRVDECIDHIPTYDNSQTEFAWSLIYRELEHQGLQGGVASKYEYMGGLFSLPEFLFLYGGHNNCAEMQWLANLLKSAVNVAYAKYNNDYLSALKNMEECGYYECRLMTAKQAENVQVANNSNTGGDNGREANSLERKRRVDIWVNKAQELADEIWNKKLALSKPDVAKQIRPKLVKFFEEQGDFVQVPGIKRIRQNIIKPVNN